MAVTRYTAAEADVDLVAGDLVRLWSGNLHSMAGEGPAKLDWYYRASPNGRARVVVLRAHGDSGDALVGCEGIGFRRVWCGERTLRAALLADLAVDGPHRTMFPALTLVREARSVAAGAADFQYGFPNDRAVGLFKRLGYPVLGTMVRYARVLRFAPYLAQRVGVPALARLGGGLLDLGDAALRGPPRMWAAARHRLAFLPGPDPRFNQLFEEARRRYRVIGERGSDFLRWRFFARPGPVSLAALLRRSDGALRAYAVVTQPDRTAHLSDFLGASEPELRALFALLLPSLAARGCASASVRFLGDRSIPRVLARCGFRRRDAERAVVLDAGEVATLAATLRDTESFYLTDADEDA